MTHDRWLVRAPDPHAPRRLICLPYAGGGASIYRDWPDRFSDAGVDVLAIQLPGRENRIAEDPSFSTADVATLVGELADRPYALFGHSMGGRLAYDAATSVVAAGIRPPDLVVTSASRPPHLPRTGSLDGISTFNDAKLTARLRRSGSIPDAVLAEPDLMELLLPTLRADFSWIDALPVHAPEPLPVPILALAGALDRAVRHEQAEQWRPHTSAGFELVPLPGDHFFLRDQLDAIHAAILAAWPGPPPVAEQPRTTGGHHGPHHVAVRNNLLWKYAAVRSAGFPVGGLERLSSSEAADATDAFLDGQVAERTWRDAFADAVVTSASKVQRVAADPLFQEALAWQNPAALTIAQQVAAGRPSSTRTRRRNLQLIARYWQRYCAKNDTIGFFGPLAPSLLDPTGPTVVQPGPALVRRRITTIECWAVRAVADSIFAEPAVRALLPVRRARNVVVDPRHCAASVPPRVTVDLTATQLQILLLADGTVSAAQLIADVGLNTRSGTAVLDELQAAGLLHWGPDVPQDPTAEQWLTSTLDDLRDHPALITARADWERLRSAVATTDEAAGSADATARALDVVRAMFVRLTGTDSKHAPGQTYAGREVVHQDTTRDIDIMIGSEILDRVARPIAMLTRAARWWCAEVGAAYESALECIVTEQADGRDAIPLSEIWFVALGMIVGDGESPADQVEEEFTRRWGSVLGLDAHVARTDETRCLNVDEVERAVAEQFPQRSICWSGARVHSPDLQVAARSLDAVRAGDFDVVLGEWHSGMATLDNASSVRSHDDPDALRSALRADLGRPVVRPLLPPEWARNTGRLVTFLQQEDDVWLAFTETAARPGAALVQVSDLEVAQDTAGRLIVRTTPEASGPAREWPLLEILSSLLSIRTVDGFRHLTRRPYTPRISIGGLVLARRTWRFAVDDVPLGRTSGFAERFAEARRWRSECGFPERVFVSLSAETKPFHVDFRSPWLVGVLATALVSCRTCDGDDGAVTVSEMFPTPDECWLPDDSGDTYCSELRVQVTDAD